MPYMTLQDPETGEGLEVLAVWEICDYCRGDGGSSAYLGDFSSDALAELGDEWCEDYMRGRFDQTCQECKGSGKVMFPDFEAMTDAMKVAWESECAYRAELAWERSMRERGIEF